MQEGGITWQRLPDPIPAWEHVGKCYQTGRSCEVISLGKLPVQAEERGGCREALGGDGYVTPQELMGGKQEPMGGKREHFASCGTSGLKRLWHVSSAFPAPCRVLRQQTAPPEAAGLQWSLLATPLASPGGQSWEREAVVSPWGFARLPGVRSALHNCSVQVFALWLLCSSCLHTECSLTWARGGGQPRSGCPCPV